MNMNFTQSFEEFSSSLGVMDVALYAGVGLVLWVLFKDKLSPVQALLVSLFDTVKSVVPTVLILYLLPTTKLPDIRDDDALNETNVPPGTKLILNVVGDTLVT